MPLPPLHHLTFRSPLYGMACHVIGVASSVLDAVENYNERWVELWQQQERAKLAETEGKQVRALGRVGSE